MTKTGLKFGRFQQHSYDWNNEPPDEAEASTKPCFEDCANELSADVSKTDTNRNGQSSVSLCKLILIFMVIIPFHAVDARSYKILKPDERLCPFEHDDCVLYGKGQLMPGYCFSGRCPADTNATCVKDGQPYFICLSNEEISCDAGYHGIFHFDEKQNEINFSKEQCQAGTYTKMSQDCRLPCNSHLKIDQEKYSVLVEPTHTGTQAFVECNKNKGFCPVHGKLGTKFYYTKEVHLEHEEACKKAGAGVDCLRDDVFPTDSKDIREVNFTTTSPVTPLSSTNNVVLRKTQPEATVSTASPKPTDSDKGVPKKSGLTEFQIGMIVAGVIGFLLLFLVVVLVVYLCCKYRKFPFLKDTASDALVEIESGSDSSGSMKKSPMVNTNAYYELNGCRVYMNRNESSSESVNEGSSLLSSGTGGSVEEDQENMELLDAGGTTPEEE